MRFEIPNGQDKEKMFESLVEWLDNNHPEPFHKNKMLNHKVKYLGHYVLTEEVFFQVYDLYQYDGSDFVGRVFYALYGDGDNEYVALKESLLMTQDNKELMKTPTGEAYRRFRKRKPKKGIILTK